MARIVIFGLVTRKVRIVSKTPMANKNGMNGYNKQ